VIAGLFGHRRTAAEPPYLQWLHAAVHWCGAHWQILAVVIPVAGALVAGIMNHSLAVAREKRARQVRSNDLRTRVHADLAVRLLAHCSELTGALRGDAVDLAAWSARNARLRARSESEDVIEALGRDYVAFVAAIEKERRAIAALAAKSQPSAAARTAVQLYAPFIADFGEPTQAHRLRNLLSPP